MNKDNTKIRECSRIVGNNISSNLNKDRFRGSSSQREYITMRLQTSECDKGVVILRQIERQIDASIITFWQNTRYLGIGYNNLNRGTIYTSYLDFDCRGSVSKVISSNVGSSSRCRKACSIYWVYNGVMKYKGNEVRWL